MRMRLKIIFFFIIASFCFLYLGAQEAQAILVPQIYITDIKITKAGSGPGETLEGTISLWNYEKYVVGDLVFRYQLLGGEKNGVSAQLINEKISAEVFKLAAGEKSDKQFVYALPANLPEGNFTFRVQLANARGEELSWIDTDVQIKSDSGFLTLNNYWIVRDGKNFSAGAGVYYPPGEAAEVKFDVNNGGKSNVTAYLKITTSKMNAGLAGQIVGESEQESAVFGPGTKKTINVKLPELSQPESYLTEIRFYDTSTKNLISNSIFFRWIIEGKNDAQIQFVNLDKESYVKGEKIKIFLQFTGPAAFPELPCISALITVDIFDENDSKAGYAEKQVNCLKPTQMILTAEATKDINNPKVKASILKGSEILDSYESIATSPPPATKPSAGGYGNIIYLAAVLALVLVIIILYVVKLKMKKNNIAMLLLFLGGALFFSFSPLKTMAAVEVAWDTCGTTVVFNSPAPNQTYNPGDVVNFSGKLRVSSCGNGLFHNMVGFYIAEDRDMSISSQNRCDADCWGPGAGSYPICALPQCPGDKYVDGEPVVCESNERCGHCNDVMQIDESGTVASGVRFYELGVVYPPDVAEGARPYWVEFNQDFVIPGDLDFAGSVRFYVQYSGTHWHDHWHWSVLYQEGYINPPPGPDNPPYVVLKLNNQGGVVPVSSGSTAKLTWSTVNCTADNSCTCSASGNWSGSKSISGGFEMTPVLTDPSYAYQISCTNLFGSSSDEVYASIGDYPDFTLQKTGDINIKLIRGTKTGDSTETVLYVDPNNGFNDQVTLSIQNPGAIPGAEYHFSDTNLAESEYGTGSRFWVTVPGNALDDQYILILRGDAGGLVRTINVGLNLVVVDPSYHEF